MINTTINTTSMIDAWVDQLYHSHVYACLHKQARNQQSATYK